MAAVGLRLRIALVQTSPEQSSDMVALVEAGELRLAIETQSAYVATPKEVAEHVMA